ncbi:hypothetical protein B0H17DRAFT_1132228 [Mycena rosella]|uniref:Secreted protein n=1 Tax=Mycena rosella TaxID=1033263 RepID=A0AAD7DL60_MYCRO|nr:hypothetical protein B0H17DRAFT_1132228 [Mycena rosella]
MPVAWLGLKARALAWLEWAWAWNSSGQSPSPPPGLGLAWLWPEPGLEDFGGLNPVYLFKMSIYFRHVFDATCALWIIPLRASNFCTMPKMLRQSPEHARKGNNAAWLGLAGLRASDQATGITRPMDSHGSQLLAEGWASRPLNAVRAIEPPRAT